MASTTTNRLHFSDLDATRFEDLCLAIIFPLHRWIEILHYGRQGNDGGIDIYARERVENGVEREWFVQCKRYNKASRKTLTQAVDEALKKCKAPPDVLLLVLACDIQRPAHDVYTNYASAKGIGQPLLWQASTLEARLYNERKDLLFTYFGISEVAQSRQREETIRRNIALKSRMLKDFLKPYEELVKLRDTRPGDRHARFRESRLIVRSIDDSSYPDTDEESVGISGWFRVEPYDFYHNGLKVILGIQQAAIDHTGNWGLLRYAQAYDKTIYSVVNVFEIACIPFRNIVDYDLLGDEYYGEPHLFCTFSDSAMPYEAFCYVTISDKFPDYLEPEKRVELPLLKEVT